MKKKLMVVDDSRIMELQICKLLEDSDFEVVTMDIIMPGIDGLETAQVLLEEYPEAKILMVSSLAYEGTIQEADRIGTRGFLYKPLSREKLIEALENTLA